MSDIISSTFSINMLKQPSLVNFQSMTRDEFVDFCKTATSNFVNPRHASTAALVDQVATVKSAGGFASVSAGDVVGVIMPPRDLMNRDAAEINLDDLDGCQFWRVVIS